MRRHLPSGVGLTLRGFLFGAVYRHVVDAPDEETIGYYLRSGVHGATLVLSGWAVHLYFTSRSSVWVRRWPLVVELVVRSVAMAAVIAAVAQKFANARSHGALPMLRGRITTQARRDKRLRHRAMETRCELALSSERNAMDANGEARSARPAKKDKPLR